MHRFWLPLVIQLSNYLVFGNDHQHLNINGMESLHNHCLNPKNDKKMTREKPHHYKVKGLPDRVENLGISRERAWSLSAMSCPLLFLSFFFPVFFSFMCLLFFGYFSLILFSELQGDASSMGCIRGSGHVQLSLLFPDRANVFSNFDGIQGSAGKPSTREPDRIQPSATLPSVWEWWFRIAILVEEFIFLQNERVMSIYRSWSN